MKSNRSVTSKDVAKLAGVSQSTVSRVFNPNSNREVKPDIKEIVLDAGKKLGYKPNIIARGLVSKKTNMVGVVVANPIGPFYSKIITELTSKLQQNGAQPLIFTLEDQEDIQKIIDKVLQYQVDGVIITSSALSVEMADECIENDLPTVLFNVYKNHNKISCIYSDNRESGRMVAKLLVDTGHKNIAHITYKKQAFTIVERKQGFYEELKKHGLEYIIEESCDYTYEAGYEVGLKLIQKKNIPDGVFCVSDVIAMGVIDAIKNESDLKIPEDIAIIGFDDIPQASWKSYDLTTIHQPVELLIDKSVDALFKLINKTSTEDIIEKISTEIVIRQSTRNIKK
ncbi:MAG: LacI family DNA-binding transcriptional regulator [Terrisporobacter sp.]